jgi:hypothetical protein
MRTGFPRRPSSEDTLPSRVFAEYRGAGLASPWAAKVEFGLDGVSVVVLNALSTPYPEIRKAKNILVLNIAELL